MTTATCTSTRTPTYTQTSTPTATPTCIVLGAYTPTVVATATIIIGTQSLGNLPYFRPGNYVTRGQAAKIVANTFWLDDWLGP